MSRREQIYNWLTTVLQQPADRLSEIFYYDKRDNEFFSILVTDYFIFDKNLNVTENKVTTYTKENLETLIDRIRRIENKDVKIFFLPWMGISPNTADTKFISKQTYNFLNLNSIKIETATIW